VHSGGKWVVIDTIRDGRRFASFSGEETDWFASSPPASLDPATNRDIRLRLDKPDGGRVDVTLLRSLDWIEDYGAHVGGTIWLDMKEMAVVGLAEVLAIEPCPPLEEGKGRLVTGTFHHPSGEVYDLKLASESKPLGVTATHPFWSCDRNDWVSAINLRIGETLKTLTGTTHVERITKRPQPEPVYNIEVEGDHVYRVGESGVLVHNASAGCSGLNGCGRVLGRRGTASRRRRRRRQALGSSMPSSVPSVKSVVKWTVGFG
jgi:hypothetical protein